MRRQHKIIVRKPVENEKEENIKDWLKAILFALAFFFIVLLVVFGRQ